MGDATNGAILTLSYASSIDFVLVELWISKNNSVIAPASIVLSDNGGYEIHLIDNTIFMQEETYGKKWRCWELREPHKIERDSVPWN